MAPLPPPPTEILIAAKRGDMHAFTHIVSHYEHRIYGFIIRMVNNRDDAAELTQETFLKLYQHIHTYEPGRPFGAWMFTIARHVVYDWFRKSARHRVYLAFDDPDSNEDPPDTHADAFRSPLQLAAQLDIERALAGLRPIYREVLLLHYWQGYTYDEIAGIISVPTNTVKTFVRRAKIAIRNHHVDSP
ncbi:RNA polymerase sigma factor [Candidatus Uhrbacteria bacterium]|nr:RNA polymerase sigma factor [Candidatus Uhrbacteria bacterium]